MSVRKEAEAEKQKLKNMSWKDRAWYVWEYYKFHILALILAAGALWTVGTMIYRQTFTTRLSIAVINDRAGTKACLQALVKTACPSTIMQLLPRYPHWWPAGHWMWS